MYVWQCPAVGWSNDVVTCGHDVLLPLVLIVVVTVIIVVVVHVCKRI
jgi:hypothetical protein